MGDPQQNLTLFSKHLSHQWIVLFESIKTEMYNSDVFPPKHDMEIRMYCDGKHQGTSIEILRRYNANCHLVLWNLGELRLEVQKLSKIVKYGSADLRKCKTFVSFLIYANLWCKRKAKLHDLVASQTEGKFLVKHVNTFEIWCDDFFSVFHLLCGWADSRWQIDFHWELEIFFQ